jgi:hypothetical protein
MLLRALELEKPKIEPRDDYYVATLLDLGLMCPGRTKKEALNNIRKTQFSLLRALAERGVLEARMKERGIRMVFVYLPEVIQAEHEIVPVNEDLP